MKLTRHKLTGENVLPYEAARWIGGEITPSVIICHDTASRLEHGAAAAYLRENPRKVSVHFVVERDATVRQQVPTNRRANHAGKSHYHGRDEVNGFSIGIEIVNPGRMEPGKVGQARAWFGEEFPIHENAIVLQQTKEHGSGLWMPYTSAQIGTTLALCGVLADAIPTIRDIRTHWYVSPGRKIDTNPLFPLDALRSLVLGRDDPSDEDADGASKPLGDGQFIRVNTPGDTLSMRRWPSFNPNVVGAIPHGTAVPVIREGVFDGRVWNLVRYGPHEGWVVAAYTETV